jgi:hypothetical protein
MQRGMRNVMKDTSDKLEHRTSGQSDWHSCRVYERSRVQISARTPGETFRGFSQPLQENSETVP